MTTTNGRLPETERPRLAQRCWPECVEESYERLVAAVVLFATQGSGNEFSAATTPPLKPLAI
jgi:hypothetical protein